MFSQYLQVGLGGSLVCLAGLCLAFGALRCQGPRPCVVVRAQNLTANLLPHTCCRACGWPSLTRHPMWHCWSCWTTSPPPTTPRSQARCRHAAGVLADCLGGRLGIGLHDRQGSSFKQAATFQAGAMNPSSLAPLQAGMCATPRCPSTLWTSARCWGGAGAAATPAAAADAGLVPGAQCALLSCSALLCPAVPCLPVLQPAGDVEKYTAGVVEEVGRSCSDCMVPRAGHLHGVMASCHM